MSLPAFFILRHVTTGRILLKEINGVWVSPIPIDQLFYCFNKIKRYLEEDPATSNDDIIGYEFVDENKTIELWLGSINTDHVDLYDGSKWFHLFNMPENVSPVLEKYLENKIIRERFLSKEI